MNSRNPAIQTPGPTATALTRFRRASARWSARSTHAAAACAASLILLMAAPASSDEIADTLAAVRAAVERFQDVEVALAEGYVRDPDNHCFTAEMMGMPPELGAMGLHYFRPDLLGVTATAPKVDGNGLNLDWGKPSILIYEPQSDGSLALVAVENLVFQAAWEAAGNTEPPTLLGRTWDTMADDPATEVDEAHGFTPHHDQHVWVFRDNPKGALEPFNPAATCEHHEQRHAHN